jgi:hypothetical protein
MEDRKGMGKIGRNLGIGLRRHKRLLPATTRQDRWLRQLIAVAQVPASKSYPGACAQLYAPTGRLRPAYVQVISDAKVIADAQAPAPNSCPGY